MKEEFKFVRVSAPDAFGRGKEYGEQAREEVGLCVETYKEHLSRLKGLDWQQAREEAGKYLPLVEAALPWETDMLRGVAVGSGADFEDVMVLNTRYEILHYPANECTTYAVLREATREGKVFIGQNWDQRPIVTPHSIILHVTMEDGTKIMGMTEAGQLLRNGISSRGLGLTASGLNSSLDRRQIGIPGNFLRMRALRSKSFDEMAELIVAFQRAVANNYCIASDDSRALDIEGIPQYPALFHPKKGIVTHANHILSRPELDASKGRKFRGERLAELLGERTGDITADYIRQCLADHKEFPDSICSHIEDGITDMHRAWMTVSSMIYNLTDLEFEVSRGNPCENEYKKYKLLDY